MVSGAGGAAGREMKFMIEAGGVEDRSMTKFRKSSGAV